MMTDQARTFSLSKQLVLDNMEFSIPANSFWNCWIEIHFF